MLNLNELHIYFFWDASECLFAPHEGSCKVDIVDDASDGDIGGEDASSSVQPVINRELCPDFSDCKRPNEKVGWNCKKRCCGY